VSLPEADDPDFESLGIADHLKCEGDFRGVKDDLFQTIGGEKQNLKMFRPACAEPLRRRQGRDFRM
jgi:hypothetical protein